MGGTVSPPPTLAVAINQTGLFSERFVERHIRESFGGRTVVVADTAGKWPYLEDVTSDFVYVRLHGDRKLYESGYTVAALERWAARIRAWARGGDVFVYFDNDIKVKAPRDAMRLADMLGVAWTPADDRFGNAKGRSRGPLRPERRRNPWPGERAVTPPARTGRARARWPPDSRAPLSGRACPRRRKRRAA